MLKTKVINTQKSGLPDDFTTFRGHFYRLYLLGGNTR